MGKSMLVVIGLMMSGFSAPAFAVSDPQSVSLQDRRPECKERHPEIAPEQCVIQNGPAPLEYARRFGGDAVIVVTPPPRVEPAASGAAGTSRENANRAAPERRP